MQKVDTKVVILAALITVALIIASGLIGSVIGRRKVINGLEVQRDTTVRVVTVYKDFPDPVKSAQAGFIQIPKYMFVTDTLALTVEVPGETDTVVQYVYLPREQKYYEEEEGKLRMWISGFQPVLDRYEFDMPTVTVTNTVYVKPSRWSFSISAGWGVTYGIVNKALDTGPTVVVGGSFSF